RRVQIYGSHAYVADGTNGFRIFDISGNAPVQVGVCGTSPCDLTGSPFYDVFVLGSYAYVSNGMNGLRIVDVSNPSSPQLIGTFNTPGTARATRLSGNAAYVADESAMMAIDISNPAAPLLIDTYPTPYRYTDLEIENEWAYLTTDSGIKGLITIPLATGPKINQAQTAAHSFVDYNGWNTSTDQLGLVTYASQASLASLLTNDFPSIHSPIDAMTAIGQTATSSGVRTATDELTSLRHNPLALKFQVMMADGKANAGGSVQTAAIHAANNDIVIYTVGFGRDADEAELTSIATITGGKYYYAEDQNSLIDVFDQIARDIRTISSDANLFAAFDSGTTIVDDGNGTVMGGNLVFDINADTPPPWSVTYTFNIPCASQLACQTQIISIPSPGTYFEYIDLNGNPVRVDWNVFVTDVFHFRDLNINILSGDLLSPNNVDLTLEIMSGGTLDAPASEVRFYRGPPTQNDVIGSHSVPPLCGQLNPTCLAFEYAFTQNLGAEGELYAVVNPDGTIPECAYNNEDVLFCYYSSGTQFYTLDYWAWLHE
ncbi:MAG: VWA domain-containing protein, partial [archaeon]|nr:VWA domain-containing protein [archaeon]